MIRRPELSLAISRPQIYNTRTFSSNPWLIFHWQNDNTWFGYITFHFNVYHHQGNHFIFYRAGSLLLWLRLITTSLLSLELFPTEYEVRNTQNRFRILLGNLITELQKYPLVHPDLWDFTKNKMKNVFEWQYPHGSDVLTNNPRETKNLKKTTLILLQWE